MLEKFFHLGAEAAATQERPFDPAAALAAEGIPIPQPIDIVPMMVGNGEDRLYRFTTLDEIEKAVVDGERRIPIDQIEPGLRDLLAPARPMEGGWVVFENGNPPYVEAEPAIAAVTTLGAIHTGTIRAERIQAGSITGTNPKEAAGAKKPAIWSVMPRWVTLLVGRVMQTGAAKYGKFNYRETPIYASTYEDAIDRHIQLWFDGEDTDSESGVSHLAHVIACAVLLLDSQATGKLVDDRQKTGLARRAMNDMEGLLRTLPLPERKL